MYIQLHEAVKIGEVLKEAGEHAHAESFLMAARAADLRYGSTATLSLDLSGGAGYATEKRNPNCACVVVGSASCPVHADDSRIIR